MSKWSFDRTFAALFVGVLILTVLGFTDVIGDSAVEMITIGITLAMIVFLATLGESAAKHGVPVVLLIGALGRYARLGA
jgi:hypothetical protein